MKLTTSSTKQPTFLHSSLEHLSDEQVKLLGRDALWRLAKLPPNIATELNQISGLSEPDWFNTFGAAFYCHCKTGEPTTDWHSKLMENRRNQNDMISALLLSDPPPPRGNVERLGEVRCFHMKRKVYYNARDLNVWLSDMKAGKVH